MIFYIWFIMLLSDVSESSSDPSDDELKIFQYIDHHQDTFVQSLLEWVAVESDSVQPQLRKNIMAMIKIAEDRLRALGATVELRNVSAQEADGQNLSLPPIILAELGNDAEKPTVCFYGHLDVMPAKREDGWKTDPYKLTEMDGKLYGRGTTDDKGPVLAWINAVGVYIALNMTMPVNIKFLLEGMEEAGSPGLENLLKEENKGFFSNVMYIVISDNNWLSNEKPALTYGSRGNAGFFVEVECCKNDLHSGSFGGIVHEAMSDLIALLGSLVDSSGRILIPDLYEDVAAIPDEELKLYTPIDFNFDEQKASIGVKEFLYKTKEDILLHLWRLPSLSIHGIEGAFSEPGIKTVIPSKVIGKFSIRQVPNMNLSTVERQVKEHLKSVFSKRNSPNKLTVSMPVGAMPWIANIKGLVYEAARRAIKTVFQQDPDMIWDGSTIPVAKMFEDITKKSVMMFPVGAADDGAHSQNEKINRLNYINGTKVFASFFLEISKLHSASNLMAAN